MINKTASEIGSNLPNRNDDSEFDIWFASKVMIHHNLSDYVLINRTKEDRSTFWKKFGVIIEIKFSGEKVIAYVCKNS